MKLRERPMEPDLPGGTATPGAPADGGDTLRRAQQLADATDAAIRSVLSGNSEQFLASNRQQGGQ